MRNKKAIRATILSIIIGSATLKAGMPVMDALAMIETGAVKPTACKADYKVGRAGEVSRYQVKPAVWRKYSPCKRYTSPDVARQVASAILGERTRRFVTRYHRPPTTNELYILWNAPGQLLYGTSKPTRTVKERAQRFANLVHH